MNQQREQFDSDLSEALAADDVAAALDELSHRYAGDAQAGERIRSARRVVDDLVSIGERLADEPAPAMPKLNLPARRIRPWWIAVPAAAAAAAVIIAVLLQGPTTTKAPRPTVITPPPQQPTLAWRVPSVAPVPLPDGAFTVPKVSIPSISMSLPEIGWSVPSITGDYSERSTNNET